MFLSKKRAAVGPQGTRQEGGSLSRTPGSAAGVISDGRRWELSTYKARPFLMRAEQMWAKGAGWTWWTSSGGLTDAAACMQMMFC